MSKELRLTKKGYAIKRVMDIMPVTGLGLPVDQARAAVISSGAAQDAQSADPILRQMINMGFVSVATYGTPAKPNEMGYIARGTYELAKGAGEIGAAAGQGMSWIGKQIGRGLKKL